VNQFFLIWLHTLHPLPFQMREYEQQTVLKHTGLYHHVHYSPTNKVNRSEKMYVKNMRRNYDEFIKLATRMEMNAHYIKPRLYV
jgi:hypothetical protein